MTMVPWSVLAAEQVETIASVLLGRHCPRSIRVRPAQGDGGIDVLDPLGGRSADVYQIKRFASALTADQKRQIKKSLASVADNSSVAVRDWHLVLPLNPSPRDLKWLANLNEGVPFECHWFGLDRLESLAAAYQDVVDYYIGDGRRRLEESIDQLRALMGFAPSTNGGLIAPDDTTEALTALYRLLNRDDPHYRYDIEIGAEPPAVRPLLARPLLVASRTEITKGVSITHHIFARYEMATEDRPVPLTFSVRADLMDDDVREAWQRALRYGTPVTLPAPLVTDLCFGLPGGLDSTATEGTLRIWPSRPEDARPYRLRLRVINPDEQLIGEVLLEMEPITRGIGGSGWRAHGFAPGRAFEIEMTCDIDDAGGSGPVVFGITVGPLAGASPLELHPSVCLLTAMHEPNLIQFAPEYGPAPESSFPIPDDEPPVTDALVELIEALAELQDKVDGTLRTPDLEALTQRSLHEILRAARLVRGETLRDTWTEREIPIALTGSAPDPSAPVQIALSGSSSVCVGDHTVTLDPITRVLLAATLGSVERDDGTTLMRATPALGNNTMLVRLASIEDVPPQSIHDPG